MTQRQALFPLQNALNCVAGLGPRYDVNELRRENEGCQEQDLPQALSELDIIRQNLATHLKP